MNDTRSDHTAKTKEHARQPLKVLLVEDMENDALLVLRQLEKDGFEPIHQRVYDPEAMARALRENEWEVVLSDYSMPQFKAPDALAILKKSGLDLPFIVISGTVGEDVAVETMRAGAHDYFVKGKLKRLGEAVRREMDAARQRRERKSIAFELRDSEARFAAAFALSPIGVGIADLDGKLVEANPSLCDIVGYPRHDVIGKTVIDLGAMRQEERERVLAQADSSDGVLENYEVRFHRKDGAVRDTLLSLHPITLKGEPHRLASVLDITQRKRAEERQMLNGRLLNILNRPWEWEELLTDLVDEIRAYIGFDAVAIRLRKEGDFPYHAYNGFDKRFVSQEDLLKCPDEGETVEGVPPQLACTCGLVISGNTPGDDPLFTDNGSFWCNNTTTLLSLDEDQDPRHEPRNRCIHEGYMSMALIPVRSGKEIVGLLQLNDRLPDRLTLDMVRFFEDVCNSIGVFFQRIKLEKVLQLERDRLRTVLEALPYGIIVISRDYDVQYAGPLLEREFGPVEGRKCHSYLHDLDEVCSWCNHDRVFAGENVNWEREFPKNGRTYQLFDSRIEYYDGSLSKMEIFVDITKRRRAEEELGQSERYNRTLFEESPTGLALCRMDGTMVDVNPAFARILGRTVEETVDLTYWQMTPEKYKDMEQLQLERMEETGRYGPYEKEYIHKDGHLVPVRLNGLFVEMGGERFIWSAVEDITESKRAEEALRESESRFRTLYSTMAQGVVYQDAEGRIIRANQAAERILGLTLDQMRGRTSTDPDWKAIREDGSPLPGQEHPSMVAMQRGEPVYGVSMGIFHPIDQDYRWVLIDAIPQNEGGEDIVYTTFSDITERKRAEMKQKELFEQLGQAQKMESVGRLAGGVAHDFNNMLSVILGYTEMALDKTPPEDPLHKDMRAVINAAQRSVDITRQLLAFARKQAIDPKPLDLNEAVEGMLKMLRRLIGEDINLIWRPCAGSAIIFMDQSQLDQVLANLCVNARDAIAGVGKLIIETDIVWLDENYIADRDGFEPGRYVLLAASDDGCGMDKETTEHIFEPFFTTKEVGRGTGLGLSTVYGIVKQNNAFINVYSEPGQGTTFKIYLPLHDRPVAETAGDGLVQIAEGRGETVLVVEDESSILTLATRILDGLGYVVLRAGLPSRALELAEEYAGKIDLLVTDVVLPEMNGYELAEKLHARHPGLKVVYMSGYTEDVLAKRRDMFQDANFIQKPFTITTMARKVREALDENNN